ncbi:YgjV family protein [Dactylosporangium sp. NPDC005555]|uniref:YgjV family protein n=1 Tax=Dactylosporangium sp. NPDC005555 TaxID=3154889 RepID=UPI0033BCD782
MNWLDVIGWVGSAVLVWSLSQARLLRLRVLNLIGSVVLVVYNAALSVWPMVGLNAAMTGINAFHLYRMHRTRHDDATYTVVPVGTDDTFLAHVLRVHWADLAKFNPSFGFDDAPGRAAFLIMRGDEVVGVLILRPASTGVAQIELDYVTQRFRDVSPGEFVFRSSGLLTALGYHRVLTPPGMVAPYYGRLGFQRTGDHYELELVD